MWYRLARLNNRTHRELLVIDGEVAFVGGAGIADWWLKPLHGKPIWRDMMARIEGPVVTAIQGIAAENYLECCGAILSGQEVYKELPEVGRKRRVRGQELAGRSRHGLARAVPDADRRRRTLGTHQHAVFSAGQGIPSRAQRA